MLTHSARLATLGLKRTAALRPRIAPSTQPTARSLHASVLRYNVPMWPNNPMPQPPVTADDDFTQMMKDHRGRDKAGEGEKQSFWKEWSHSPGFQAALTTIVGLVMVFGGGIGYLQWYKAHVLNRVRQVVEELY